MEDEGSAVPRAPGPDRKTPFFNVLFGLVIAAIFGILANIALIVLLSSGALPHDNLIARHADLPLYVFVGVLLLAPLSLGPYYLLLHIRKRSVDTLTRSRHLKLLSAWLLVSFFLVSALALWGDQGIRGNLPCETVSAQSRDAFMPISALTPYFFWFGLMGGVALLGVTLYFSVKYKDRVAGAFTLVLIVTAVLAVLLYWSSGHVSRSGRDARRASDLRQVQGALELYHGAHGMYPVVEGWDPASRWNGLERTLTEGDRPIVMNIPQDPCGDVRQYDYASSADGTRYVLRALLQDPQSPLLNGPFDRDGDALGVWCGEDGEEIEYCVVP